MGRKLKQPSGIDEATDFTVSEHICSMTTASYLTLITPAAVSRGFLLEEWYDWKARV
jgi:hypothetical protein